MSYRTPEGSTTVVLLTPGHAEGKPAPIAVVTVCVIVVLCVMVPAGRVAVCVTGGGVAVCVTVTNEIGGVMLGSYVVDQYLKLERSRRKLTVKSPAQSLIS